MSNPKGNEKSLIKFKQKWRLGKTKTIRVPVAIADEVLNYARQLDESEQTTPDFLQEIVAERDSYKTGSRNWKVLDKFLERLSNC